MHSGTSTTMYQNRWNELNKIQATEFPDITMEAFWIVFGFHFPALTWSYLEQQPVLSSPSVQRYFPFTLHYTTDCMCTLAHALITSECDLTVLIPMRFVCIQIVGETFYEHEQRSQVLQQNPPVGQPCGAEGADIINMNQQVGFDSLL